MLCTHLPHPLLVIVTGHGFRKIVALDHIAAFARKEINLFLDLDAFCNDAHVEALGKLDGFGNNDLASSVGGFAPEEIGIQLEHIQWHVFQGIK